MERRAGGKDEEGKKCLTMTDRWRIETRRVCEGREEGRQRERHERGVTEHMSLVENDGSEEYYH